MTKTSVSPSKVLPLSEDELRYKDQLEKKFGNPLDRVRKSSLAKILLIVIAALLIIGGGAVYYFNSLFSAPQKQAESEVFVVSTVAEQKDIKDKLLSQGFIKNAWAFDYALTKTDSKIDAGGYRISKSMDAWTLAKTVADKPALVWVTIPEGLRKEEIGERLAKALGWDEKALHEWTYTYTAMDYDHLEGVYFPDTYLIPTDENGLDAANRLRRRFDEQFAPYMTKFLKQDVKWTTALKIASIVQREAGGKSDMPLIAGILWNRLLKNMKLEVDATVQYARDDRDELTTGFWKPITVADKEIDSKYNTYKYAGLPPFPISNPGIDAIDAVLNSEETDCLYYLHDSNRQIHCAVTYEEHLQNIKNYLLKGGENE